MYSCPYNGYVFWSSHVTLKSSFISAKQFQILIGDARKAAVTAMPQFNEGPGLALKGLMFHVLGSVILQTIVTTTSRVRRPAIQEPLIAQEFTRSNSTSTAIMFRRCTFSDSRIAAMDHACSFYRKSGNILTPSRSKWLMHPKDGCTLGKWFYFL